MATAEAEAPPVAKVVALRGQRVVSAAGARPAVGMTDIDLIIGLAVGDESPEAYQRWRTT